MPTRFHHSITTLAAVLATLLVAGSASAAMLFVNDLADQVDSTPGDGICATVGAVCTLRAAIMEANALAGPDEIFLPAGTMVLSLAGAGDSGDDLDILDDLVITGNVGGTTVIDANVMSRAIRVGPSVSLVAIRFSLVPGTATAIAGSAFLTEAEADLDLRNVEVLERPATFRADSMVEHRGNLLVFQDVEFSNSLSSRAGIYISPAPTSLPSVQISDSEFTFANSSTNHFVLVDGAISTDLTVMLTDSSFDGPGAFAFLANNSAASARIEAQIVRCDIRNFTNVAVQSSMLLSPGISAFTEIIDTEIHTGSSGAAISFQNDSTVIASNQLDVIGSLIQPAPFTEGVITSGNVFVRVLNSTFDGGKSLALNPHGAVVGLGFANNATFSGEVRTTPGSGTVLQVQNSVVDGCDNFDVVSSGYNLFGAFGNCTITGEGTNQQQDPMLGPLADHGGPTRTRAPLPGSGTLDGGNPSVAGSGGQACEALDQRGVGRPIDGNGDGTAHCDIGAHELGAAPGFDFGDAHASYQTTFFDNGPRHKIGFLFLGASIDEDADGQAGSSATGDDLDGTDDEDGVVFAQPATPGQNLNVEITASDAGFVSLWLDSDASGDFVGDEILIDEPVVAGPNTFTFILPGITPLGSVVARVRLDSAGGLDFMGEALDGEVEDLRLNVSRPADIAVALSVDQEFIPGPGPVMYTAVITNAGPDDIIDGLLVDEDFGWLSNEVWGCTTTGGASCATVSGVGPVETGMVLPVGDTITITVDADISATPFATVTYRFVGFVGLHRHDTDPSNNLEEVTTTVGTDPHLFSDGFESGGADQWAGSGR